MDRLLTLLFIPSYQDENRYSAVRGAHKNLKRAEKARILVSKIPCESLFYFNISICISFNDQYFHVNGKPVN